MSRSEILDRQLIALGNMNVAKLRARFFELYGFECGATNAKGLRNRIAYKLQEIYLGGLSEEDKALLEKLADRDPVANLNFENAHLRPAAKGARFHKEWRGRTYEVLIRDDGCYEYEGEVYRSLSSVATVITGTHWNGKKFFGVK
ncbi:MAG: DUF2924 domain-containing protein [Lentisphaeria bacterium]|nr:DUF2924 domain-containing protein [Lentisphaeria bacterium]